MWGTRVGIHQQDFFALHRQPNTQILTGGAFPYTDFLIGDCDNRSFLCDNITPPENHTQSRGSSCPDRRGSWWWAHCRALPADTASCSAPGRCFLPENPARNGCGRRLQFKFLIQKIRCSLTYLSVWRQMLHLAPSSALGSPWGAFRYGGAFCFHNDAA